MYNTKYQEGYDAFMDGMTHVTCPYRSESQEYRQWIDGFYDAEKDYYALYYDSDYDD